MANDDSKSYSGSHHSKPLSRGVRDIGVDYTPRYTVERFLNGEIVPEYMAPDDPRQSWAREHRVLPQPLHQKQSRT